MFSSIHLLLNGLVRTIKNKRKSRPEIIWTASFIKSFIIKAVMELTPGQSPESLRLHNAGRWFHLDQESTVKH